MPTMPTNQNLYQRRNKQHQNTKELLPTQPKKLNANEEAKKITESLRRTKQRMSQELHRVTEVTKVLDDDAMYLDDTKKDHSGFQDTNKGASYALRRLKMQEKRDDLIFWFSLVFYCLVAFYVIWCRLPVVFI